MSARRPLYILITALVVVVASCGGDEDAGSTTATASSATTSAQATPATTVAPDDPMADAGEDRSGELLGRWQVVNYMLPGGAGITNVVGNDPVFVEFNSDNSVDYNTGCNSGSAGSVTSGTYFVPESALDDKPEGQPITIGPAFEQTERGCEGFLGDQDLDLPNNMGAATRFVIDGDRLILLDQSMLIEATKSG